MRWSMVHTRLESRVGHQDHCYFEVGHGPYKVGELTGGIKIIAALRCGMVYQRLVSGRGASRSVLL